jgi:hypothetical protein
MTNEEIEYFYVNYSDLGSLHIRETVIITSYRWSTNPITIANPVSSHMTRHNVKMGFYRKGYDSIDWIHVVQNRTLAGCYEYSNGQSGSIKGGDFLDQLKAN